MRPLPTQAIEGAPRGVMGLALIRGRTCPVVELSTLLGGGGECRRYVLLCLEQSTSSPRYVALAVSSVDGVSRLEQERWAELPPLVGKVDEEKFQAFSVLDHELCAVLKTASVLDEKTWAELVPS